MLWDILTWALLGLVAGAIAKKVMPGKDPGGIIVTMLIGIAGAVVGGLIANFIGLRSASGGCISSGLRGLDQAAHFRACSSAKS